MTARRTIKGFDAAPYLRRAAELGERLAQIPSPSLGLRTYRDALDELRVWLIALPDLRPTTLREGSETVISMGGIRASSTVGLEAACRNWIRQVRAKAGVG